MKIFHCGQKNHRSSQKGFTLIELVLYIGILAILISVLGNVFGQLVDVQFESSTTSSVNQDGRYILTKLAMDVSSSSAILIPATPGTTTNSLQITINSINYTYSLDANNNLQIVNNSTNATDVLNSYDTSVSGLTFTRVGSGDSNDTVRAAYTLTSRTTARSGKETKSFQTTLGKQ